MKITYLLFIWTIAGISFIIKDIDFNGFQAWLILLLFLIGFSIEEITRYTKIKSLSEDKT